MPKVTQLVGCRLGPGTQALATSKPIAISMPGVSFVCTLKLDFVSELPLVNTGREMVEKGKLLFIGMSFSGTEWADRSEAWGLGDNGWETGTPIKCVLGLSKSP